MAAMTKEIVLRIAKLSGLILTTEESEYYQLDLEKIVTLIQEIDAAPVENLTPLCTPETDLLALEKTHVTADTALREDTVTEPTALIPLYLDLAPQTMAQLYLVPKMLREEG